MPLDVIKMLKPILLKILNIHSPGKFTKNLFLSICIHYAKMEKTARKMPRPRPLETCGATILAMSRVVDTRTKTQKNLASSLVQKLFHLAYFLASITSPIHRHFLALLSVADDHILAIETYFPSTTFLFLKLSHLLTAAESLPTKLDGFLEKLPRLMTRAACLDMVLVQAIYWLDSLVNVLGRWRYYNNKGANEKEITVDSSFSRTGSMSEGEMKLGNDGKRVSYKEALQRGSSGEDGEESTGRSSVRGDPILDLFENGWIQNPMKRSSRSVDSLTCSRSDSYETTNGDVF